MMRTTFLVFTISIFPWILSCGKADRVHVQRSEVIPEEIKHFPPVNQRLTTNVILAWRKGATPTQMLEVSEMARQLAPLKGRHDALAAAQAPIPQALMVQIGGLIAGIKARTQTFLTPPRLDLLFNANAPTLTTPGWNVTLSAVQYEVPGGKFLFVASVENGEEYSFEMARNRYELAEQGVVSYYGNLKLKSPSGEIYYGIAQFAGQAF